jgi:hypothetical protein
MSATAPHLEITIPEGETQSNIVTLPPGSFLSTLLIPSSISGNTLTANADLGDGNMVQMRWSIDISTMPTWKGQIIPSLHTVFVGVVRIQFVTDTAQASDALIKGGYII